jgi:hypothetical protein
MAARYREHDEAWFDHIQELRWLNEGEDEYVSEYGPEDQEEEDYGVEDQDQDQEECSAEELAIFEEAWFNHVQENSWTSGCENEDQSSRMSVEDQSSRMFVEDQDQEQEEYAYRHLDFLCESFALDVSSSNSSPCATATKMEVVEEDKPAADMKARLLAAEMRVMQLESQLLTAQAVAARDRLRTQELMGILEKQTKEINKLTESLEMMTEWVIEVVRPETENCL